MAAWCVALLGLIAWAGAIGLPAIVLYLPVGGAVGDAPAAAIRSDIVIQSFLLAGLVATAAVVLGWGPARLLGSAGRSRTTGLLAAVMMAALLLPPYVLYYAWSLPTSPTSWLGPALAGSLAWSRLIAQIIAGSVVVLWFWPIAGLMIGQAWRTVDPQLFDLAELDGGRWRRFVSVTWPRLARPTVLAFAVCGVLALSEFGPFHLAGLRTIGTELSTVYELTGSPTAVANGAWPIVVVAAIVAACLAVRMRDWSAEPPTSQIGPPRNRRLLVLLTAGLAVASVLMPAGLLAANLTRLSPIRDFGRLHGDELAWSGLIAATTAALSILIAAAALFARRQSSGISIIFRATILLAMLLPGSLLAAAIIKCVAVLGLPPAIRQAWWLVSVGQSARFAGVALILMTVVRDGQDRHLAEMASADGAGPLATWWFVHLPRSWPLLAATFAVVAMLSLTELPATMVLLPAGLPNFAQRLLNQMHYALDQQVIASCLALLAAYAALTAGVVGMIRWMRARN